MVPIYDCLRIYYSLKAAQRTTLLCLLLSKACICAVYLFINRNLEYMIRYPKMLIFLKHYSILSVTIKTYMYTFLEINN